MLIRSKIAVGLAAALSVSAVGGVAFAATQGSLGSTSTGTSSLSATVTDLVQIKDIQDISINGTDTSLPKTGTGTACVYSNATSNAYKITATSANSSGGGAFTVQSGSNTMDYTLQWSGKGGSPITLTSGTQSATVFTGNDSATCASGDLSTANVSIPAATWTTSPAGDYADTLTLVVAPN